MSDINLDFTADSSNINIVADTNDITFTPTDVQLNIYTSGVGVPGGLNGALQYNNSGVLSGVPNTQFSSGNLSLGNVANVKITGGANAYYLQTDGAGTLSWVAGLVTPSGNGTAAGANNQIQISDGTGNFVSAAGFTFNSGSNVFAAPGDGYFAGDLYVSGNISGNISNSANANYANFAGTVINNNQSNITTVGTLTDLRTSNLEVHIGSNAGAVSQQSYGVAIGWSAGSNAQGATAVAIGGLAGNSQQGTSAVAIGSGAGGTQQQTQAIAIGLLAGSFQQGGNSIAIGANAGAPVQTSSSIVLNATGNNLPANNSGFYVKPIASGTGANVLVYDDTTGEITYTPFSAASISNGTSNVNIASANSNVTIGVNGTANALVIANTSVSAPGNINASRFISNVATGTAPLTVTSTTRVANLNVSQANVSDFSNVNASPATALHYLTFVNASSTGNRQLYTIGSINFNPSTGNLVVPAVNATQLAGTLTVASNNQPNITTIGTLANLNVSNTATLGNLRVNSSNVRIGASAGSISQGANSIAIGPFAGQNTQGNNGIGIGVGAGQVNQGNLAVAIGYGAGGDNQSAGAVAIGWEAGLANSQGLSAVAVGQNAGSDNQGPYTVAIGLDAGELNQGQSSIAIGHAAGRNNQATNSIIINATGANLDAPTANAWFVKPIRNVTGDPGFTVQLYYNPTTGEIGYQ
jgi:hypothetical protein